MFQQDSGWTILLDLRTVEEGRSDLVLHLDAYEAAEGHRFTIDLLCVP